MDRQFKNLLASQIVKRVEIKRQQAEIKELKEENEKLRAALSVFVAPKPSPPKTKPFRFLDLPAELRETIYELCLVKGTVYLAPRPTFDHRYNGIQPFENPTWARLGVNRQVRDETAKVLLTNNHFVLSYDQRSREKFWSTRAMSPQRSWRSMFGRPKPDPRRMLPGLVRTHLKSVSITFDIRNIANDMITVGCLAQDDRSVLANLTPAQKVLNAHDHFSQFTSEWSDMSRFLMPINHVEIDVTNAYCPLGCHRYIEEAANAIKDPLEGRRIPDTLVILGTMNKTERAQIRAAVSEGLRRSRLKPESVGVLRFQTSDCASDCSGLHFGDRVQKLVDEEVTFKTLMAAGKTMSSGQRVVVASR